MIVGVVLFDGTRNDRLNVPDDERQTVIGHLYDRLKINPSIALLRYQPGAGTQPMYPDALLDAATGYTLRHVADKEVDEVLKFIDETRKHAPDSDVRLLVSGFSRGGATARHFMNVFDQRWRERQRVGSPPRFFALIFDTVPFGQRGKLLLQVPASADMFYHFVSIDERRVAFKPVLDVSQDSVPGRIVTIPIPGAHSDVGGSYVGGVGSEYLADIDALLSGMGLLPQQCFEVDGDARLQGKNDSRWLIERLLGIGAPNTTQDIQSREVIDILADRVPEDFWDGWNARMQQLEFDGNFSNTRCTARSELVMPEFAVTRTANGFDVVSLPPIELPSARILTENGQYFLTYTFDGTFLSKVEIPASVLDNIPETGSAKLSLSMLLDGDGGYHFAWFLNARRIQ